MNRCIDCLSLKRQQQEIGENYILNAIIAHCKYVDKNKFSDQQVITKEELVTLLKKQNYKCDVTGIKMNFNRNDIFQCSIDRIDNNEGHTNTNCRLVVLGINYMRGSIGKHDFDKLINHIKKPQMLNTNNFTKAHESLLKQKYVSMRQGAKQRNIDFNLTFNDLLIIIKMYDNKCVLTNIPIDWKRTSALIGSFDRIDNSKGYDLYNVQLILWPINRAKNRFTNDDIKNLINKIKISDINHIDYITH